MVVQEHGFRKTLGASSTHLNTIELVAEMSPSGPSLSGVTFPGRHSRQVRQCRTQIWNPEICVSEANTLVDTTRESRAFGAKYIWFPEQRAAGAALVRNDGAFQQLIIPDAA